MVWCTVAESVMPPAVIVVVVKPRVDTSCDVVVLSFGPPIPDLVNALVSQIVNCDTPPIFSLVFVRVSRFLCCSLVCLLLARCKYYSKSFVFFFFREDDYLPDSGWIRAARPLSELVRLFCMLVIVFCISRMFLYIYS